MKNLFIYSLLLFCVVSVKAQEETQEVTQLDAVTINYQNDILSNVDDDTFLVREEHAGEFSANPIKFMQENFDIQSYISLEQDKSNNLRHNDSYRVKFSTNKGYLEAIFSRDGELKRTAQNFKNILVPSDIRKALYSNYKGWEMVKNRYTASGTSDKIDKEQYRIKLKNGNKSQIVKIVPDRMGSDIVTLDK